LFANRIGNKLVDGDISIWAIFGFVMKYAGQERMDCKVSTLQAVMEATIHGHLIAKRLEWFEKLCRFKFFASGFGKQLFALKAEQVTDGHETPCADTRAGSDINHRSFPDRIVSDGGQNWDRQCSGDRPLRSVRCGVAMQGDSPRILFARRRLPGRASVTGTGEAPHDTLRMSGATAVHPPWKHAAAGKACRFPECLLENSRNDVRIKP
jgi:hypothetical protein